MSNSAVLSQELKESLFEKLQSNSGVGVWSLNIETEEVYWSEQVYRIHEVNLHEPTPPLKKAIKYYHPDSLPIISEAVEKSTKKGIPWDLELKLVTEKGNEIWVHTTGTSQITDGKTAMIYGTFQDITKRKEEKAKLANALKFNKKVLKVDPSGIFIYNVVKEENEFVNEAFTKILGWTSNSINEESPDNFELIHPEDRDKVKKLLEQMLQEKSQNVYKLEYRIKCKDGSYRWVESHNSVFDTDEDGNVTKVMGTFNDITDIKSDRDLNEAILATVPIGIYIYDFQTTNNEFVNEGYKTITGWSLGELNSMGENFVDLFHESEREAVLQHMKEVQNSKEGEIITIEYRFKTKDGRWIWLQSHDSLFSKSDKSKSQLIGSFIEITAKKQLENELKEKIEELEKMNKFMVGREVKMAELKKKIEEDN